MDDEPMWAADRVVALTPGSAITIPETANEFANKGNHLTLVKGNQFDHRIKTDPHKHIHEFLRICYMFKYRDTKNEVVYLMMFSLSLTGEAETWLDELNEGTIETKAFSCNALDDLGASINLMPYSVYAKLSLETIKPTKMNVSIDVIDEILKADFDALLDEGSEILYSIEGTILEEKLFAELDEFMAMNIKENSESEFDTKESPFEKITINTDYKIKTSLEEPSSDLELKLLVNHLEYRKIPLAVELRASWVILLRP
nr:reverse transcriptase domain-containing protein [Tanacetum cinerariifolium]